MRKFLLLFAVLFFQNTLSFSQDTEWTFLKAEKGIKFYYKYVDCDFNNFPDSQWILLKAENTLDKAVYVEYSQLLWYNGVCGLCENDTNGEAIKDFKVNANSSNEGICDAASDGALRIFVKFNEFKTDDLLTKFELSNIDVTIIEE